MDGAVFLCVVLYVLFRWADSHGVFRNTIVIPPFLVYGQADASLANALAASLQARLNHVQDLFSAGHQQTVAGRLADNLGLGSVLVMPAVRAFDHATETITLQPIEFGPIKLSIGQFLFELVPKRATIVKGTYERYGDEQRLTLHESGRTPITAQGAQPAKIPELVDNLVYQLIASKWIGPPSVSWLAVKHLTEGMADYTAQVNARDLSNLPTTLAHLRNSVAAAPGWSVPKLFLGWVLLVEHQSKEFQQATGALREAATLFDDVAYNAPDPELRNVGRLAALNLYAHVVRSDPVGCNRNMANLDRLLEHMRITRNATAKKGSAKLGWRARLALGNAELALAQLAGTAGCQRAVARLKAELSRSTAPEFISESIKQFNEVAKEAPKNARAMTMADYNLTTARYSKAETLAKAKHPKKEVLDEAKEAEKAFLRLGFPRERPFVRGNFAHLHLLKATQVVADVARQYAKQATEQLRALTSEDSGYPAKWARARMIDTLVAQEDWVAATRALLEVIDRTEAEKTTPTAPNWDVLVAAPQDAQLPPVRDNEKSAAAADFGVPFFTPETHDLVVKKLQAINKLNAYGILGLIVAAELALRQQPTNLADARASIKRARDIQATHTHLWLGTGTALLLDVTEGRVLALEQQKTQGERLVDEALKNMPPLAIHAVWCEAVRAYKALGAHVKADQVLQKIPADLRTIVF